VITQPLAAEASTENHSGVLRALFDRSGMCMAKLDDSMRLVEANADFSRQFGWLPTALRGRHFTDLLDADVRTEVRQQLTLLLAEQESRFTVPTIAFRQKDSVVFSGELTGFTVRSCDNRVDALMVLIRPQGSRKKEQTTASRRLGLTKIDAHILEGIARGVSTVELAAELYLSRSGVSYRVDVLMRKLKVKNRPALISKAYFIGLLSPGWPPRVHPDYLP
jgi:PAS domain S-box-containing protein